ncbi:rhomboid family intramembrane serine protease [Streptomyces meridianus]|uniref:Rhomboid family intramembrane serine protease n=1 Tax=Streptomyces meridianus TaxID=2938945 RepID=A0ABT0X1G9_9ACTN|nr:rhomboid family intramembrane serine protease [Streptomyces meridianus]MCM2576403.1 rhomboid family intramembrane serine protease [Streptomyces meridianus]
MIKKGTGSDRPVITYTLIGLSVAVFLLGPASATGLLPGVGNAPAAAQTAHFERWGVIPSELAAGRPHALLSPLTALFVHGSWIHLLGNMLFLHVFGRMTERRMGHLQFAAFYLATGWIALVGFAVAHPGSQQTLVGASGAVSGILGAFLFLFPRARVTSLFPFLLFLPLRFPAWLVLVFWFALQWPAAHTDRAQPGVAYLAHLVGFCAGFLYAWVRHCGGSRVNGAARATEGDSQP